MILEQIGVVKLPAHDKPGGFDHAAVHGPRSKLYVAHTANDALDVLDCATHTYFGSIPDLGGVSGALVSVEHYLVFIADPPQIAVIEASNSRSVARTIEVPAAGPHGLDLEAGTQRLFCACDGKALVVLDTRSGAVLAQADLSGVPDVIFFNRERRHLYVAIGDPGLIEVFDTDQMRCLETVRTEAGAHTLGFDHVRNTLYAFLPDTHRAVVYADRG